jgi:hypothetical protein
MRAGGRGSRRAGRADRPGSREVAFPAPPADRADSLRHAIAVRAYVLAAAAAPDGDRGGLAAGPAGPVPSLAAAAPFAQRLAASARGDGLDRAAAGAGGRELAVPAAGAHTGMPGTGQRPAGASAGPARRRREYGGSPGDQLGDQAAGRRQRARGEHLAGLPSGQCHRQAPQHRRVNGGSVDGRGDLLAGQGQVSRRDPGHDHIPAASRTCPAGLARTELVTGRASPRRTRRHAFLPGSCRTRARTGRAGPAGREPGWSVIPLAATGSIRSPGPHPRMSHNAARVGQAEPLRGPGSR